jgi:hypothetical protein
MWKTLRERGVVEDIGICGNTILKQILEEWTMDRVYWIQLAQERASDEVNMTMKLGF